LIILFVAFSWGLPDEEFLEGLENIFKKKVHILPYIKLLWEIKIFKVIFKSVAYSEKVTIFKKKKDKDYKVVKMHEVRH
jgi:hypothetical protein